MTISRLRMMAAVLFALGLVACSDPVGQRALIGGGLGAAGGALTAPRQRRGYY